MSAAETQAITLSPSGAIATTLQAAGFLQLIQEEKVNLVTPAIFLDKVPALHRLAVRAVTIDPEHECFDSPSKDGKVCFSAVALQKISKSAQVDWEHVKQVDDWNDPYRVKYEAVGIITNLDGTRSRMAPGIVTLDLRGEPGWAVDKLGADTRAYLEQAEKKTSKPWDIPKGTKAVPCNKCKEQIFFVLTPNKKNLPVNPDGMCHYDTCSGATAKGEDGWARVYQARQFIDRLAATKAMSAAVRKLGIPSSMTIEKAAKPWIVLALVEDLDMNDPEQKRAKLAQMMGATAALYGKGRGLAMPPYAGSTDKPRTGPATDSADTTVEGQCETVTEGPEPWETSQTQTSTPPQPKESKLPFSDEELRLPMDDQRRVYLERIQELSLQVCERLGPKLSKEALQKAVGETDLFTAPLVVLGDIGNAIKLLAHGA